MTVATAPTVANKIWINNWCEAKHLLLTRTDTDINRRPYAISIWQHESGQCDVGVSGTCSDVPSSKAWEVQTGSATRRGMPIAIDWIPSDIWDRFAHFIKIFREADRAANENTKATPNGPGSGKGDCRSVTCEKNQLKCSDGDRYWEKPHVSDEIAVM